MRDDPDRDRGLYSKYVVRRSDGSSGAGGKHERCDYFVLDLTHDRHALVALEAYAASCEVEYPKLYDDLQDWLAKLLRGRTCVPLRLSGELARTCDQPAVIALGNGVWWCAEHAVDYHVRAHELGGRAVAALERRGVKVPEGRKIG
jgi:hypothetical protein